MFIIITIYIAAQQKNYEMGNREIYSFYAVIWNQMTNCDTLKIV